ncbi:MAG TPA: hypothetical protein VIY47_08500 [Ignavibacteriaceae bacterium]
MPATPQEHLDILGQPVFEGAYVAVSHFNQLYICKVGKMTPKMIRAHPLKYLGRNSGWLKYTSETVILSGEDALAYILKHAGA